MTIANLRCDLCDRALSGSAILDEEGATAGVRLFVHPGDPLKREDGFLLCRTCWDRTRERIGPPGRAGACAECGAEVAYEASLHVLEMTGRIGEAPLWQLCRAHAVAFLNALKPVEPKLTLETLVLKADFTAR